MSRRRSSSTEGVQLDPRNCTRTTSSRTGSKLEPILRTEPRLARLPRLHAARFSTRNKSRPRFIERAAEKMRYVHLADAWQRSDVERTALYLQPALATPLGCISTWRWGWGRCPTTRPRPHSPRARLRRHHLQLRAPAGTKTPMPSMPGSEDKAQALIDKHFGDCGSAGRNETGQRILRTETGGMSEMSVAVAHNIPRRGGSRDPRGAREAALLVPPSWW